MIITVTYRYRQSSQVYSTKQNHNEEFTGLRNPCYQTARLMIVMIELYFWNFSSFRNQQDHSLESVRTFGFQVTSLGDLLPTSKVHMGEKDPALRHRSRPPL